MAANTPKRTPLSDANVRAAATLLAGRLKQCWLLEFNWDLIPHDLREVSVSFSSKNV